jgi:hypothetical protein
MSNEEIAKEITSVISIQMAIKQALDSKDSQIKALEKRLEAAEKVVEATKTFLERNKIETDRGWEYSEDMLINALYAYEKSKEGK